MSSNVSFATATAMLAGAVIGVFLAEPKLSWKFVVGVFLSGGAVWLAGGGLFGFEVTEAALAEVLSVVIGVFFVVLLVIFGIGLLIVICENPGAAILVALLWFGLSDRDKGD
jgi:hypothetical protein